MKKSFKKLMVLGLSAALVTGSALTVFAETYTVSGNAGSTKFYGTVYAEPYSAGAYMSTDEVADLYIEDGYTKTYWGEEFTFSSTNEQSTYTAASNRSSTNYTYTRANFIVCSNDGGYNKIFANVSR